MIRNLHQHHRPICTEWDIIRPDLRAHWHPTGLPLALLLLFLLVVEY